MLHNYSKTISQEGKRQIQPPELPERCDWCPLKCGANRKAGQAGLCGADGTLRVARAALHFWEEPPISGIEGRKAPGAKNDEETGPGSGTIFFSGCSMKCVYCQNFAISGVGAKKEDSALQCEYDVPTHAKGRIFTVEDLAGACLNLQNQGAMNINFVTGTQYLEWIISAVKLARKQGMMLPIVWNSSGYERAENVKTLAEVVDVWLPDFKYADAGLGAKYSLNPVENYPGVALAAIKEILSYTGAPKYDIYLGNNRMVCGVIIRHLLLPGNLENSKRAVKMLFDEFGNSVKYSIMNQYTPCVQAGSAVALKHPELLSVPAKPEYEELLDFADSLGIEDYFWQDGPAYGESFIPSWDC